MHPLDDFKGLYVKDKGALDSMKLLTLVTELLMHEDQVDSNDFFAPNLSQDKLDFL